ncbi:hypothetical protein [Candidatus Clostridium stratigraminis]|uniref:Uncharacterized protein n=1 Tax=Candidatus Clostridium stratigraminis TaxID=3381661 RepID=A0ABW8T3A5_9CLOT
MKRIIYLIISCILSISILTSCSIINKTKGTLPTSSKSQAQSTGGGITNQNIIMLPKTGYRDEEVNICYGNIFHMFSMDMVNKYIPWDGQ